MKYAVIDTESSGLMNFKLPADDPSQPRLAELVMIFLDDELMVEREYQAYIKPEGWQMEPGATEANKLTTEFLLEKGIPAVEVLEAYSKVIVEDERILVAHNAQYDLKMMRSELRRADMDDLFERTPNICTMRGLADVCMIPPNGGRGGYKWPKLSEACVHFGFPLLGDHSALNDARATVQLFRKMHELRVLPEARVHYAKNPPAGKEAAPATAAATEGKARHVPF